jgi:DNA adenine methylase
MIKSPLRYPGGKSKSLSQIIEYLPNNFSEYREPFVGGGSLFIYLKQIYPDLKIWINDLNYELFLFWKIAQSDLDKLVKEIFDIKNSYQDGKILFEELTNVNLEKLSNFQRAVRFFVLNRITFSGTTESGGFSQQAFKQRFTISSIERLKKLEAILPGIKITNLDYSHLLKSQGKNTFLFLDPPYFTATKSKLYGKQGNLHTSFDHQKFAKLIKNCSGQWLITYDDSPEIRKNFNFSNIYEWEVQYGMNNYKQNNAAKGKELFILNYKTKQESIEKTYSKTAVQLSLF